MTAIHPQNEPGLGKTQTYGGENIIQEVLTLAVEGGKNVDMRH